ncbi:MAG: hypothetical protein J6B50_03345 [Lachnospiraceae bacterium]|nr:hypothetical protein [Lachnospiraceae bacterium]
MDGANIRLSTMDLSILSQNKVSVMTLDEKYLPTAIVLPFEGHARQSKLMHAQVTTCKGVYLDLWLQIIRQKISNQAIAHVLHNACMIDGTKVNVMSAIDMMVESYKRIILDKSDEKLSLPIILPIQSMEGITE